jgi:hypothetical protein
VGPFRADILCKDTANDQWVLIENQRERTDHSHLGQLLTYAPGLNAVTVVWIAQRFTDEHRAALDWLNEHTDDKLQFFGLEIELWRIGNSPLAPKFNIVCKPNDWTTSVQKEAAQSEGLSETKQLQLRFWCAFKQFMEENKNLVLCQKPGPKHWMNHSPGKSGIHLASIISTWDSEANSNDPQIRAEVYLDGPAAKQQFSALQLQKEAIEKVQLTWYNPEKVANCRIFVRHNTDFRNELLWQEQFVWLRQHLQALRKVFSPIVKNLAVSTAAQDALTSEEVPEWPGLIICFAAHSACWRVLCWLALAPSEAFSSRKMMVDMTVIPPSTKNALWMP